MVVQVPIREGGLPGPRRTVEVDESSDAGQCGNAQFSSGVPSQSPTGDELQIWRSGNLSPNTEW